MAIKLESKEFTKPGRVPVGGKPEKFTCNQVTDDSVDSTSIETVMDDALSLAEGSVEKVAEYLREGFNRVTRIAASGSDEATKLAKAIIKGGLANALGAGNMSTEDLAQAIREGKVKVG